MKKKKNETASRPYLMARPPALGAESRENQLISLAVDLAERQLREGTASAQVISHYLKLASPVQQLEKEKLARENELLKAKVQALQSAQNVEELYTNAIAAMQRYSGNGGVSDDSIIC